MASRADQMASNLNLSKFGQATELKNRIWFTIGALIIFRMLSFVPLPGVKPDDIHVKMQNGVLTVSGELPQPQVLCALGFLISKPLPWSFL